MNLSLFKSWKTTTGGLIGALTLALPQIQAAIDGNPATVPDWNVLLGAIAMGIGLMSARDNNVSSEQAGAK